MIEEAKAFLKKHNYIVKVTQDTNSGTHCAAIFPDGKKIDYYMRPKGVVRDKELFPCPKHARRIIIACDISHYMKKIGMSPEIIEYTDINDEVVEGLQSILVSPDTEEEIEKEKLVGYLISRASEDDFPIEYEDQAELQGVLTSYRLAKGFLV